MVYRLPVVSKEVSDRVDSGFKVTPEYGNILLKRYSRINPVLLKPIDTVPENTRPYASFSLLSTIRKLEEQARIDGLDIPIVTEEVASMVSMRFDSYIEEDKAKLAMEYFEGNREMFKSVTGSITRIPEKHRKDVLYSTMLALGYIIEQGNRNIDRRR